MKEINDLCEILYRIGAPKQYLIKCSTEFMDKLKKEFSELEPMSVLIFNTEKPVNNSVMSITTNGFDLHFTTDWRISTLAE